MATFTACSSDGWRSLGQGARDARQKRSEASPQWQDGAFVDPQPMTNSLWGALDGAMHTSPTVSPEEPVPVMQVDPKSLLTPPASGLRVTWLGHSTTLIEFEGTRLLTDPVWSERASPFTWAGPKRWYLPPIALKDLPKIDAVLISHDHYDHLDYGTITAMKDWNTTFIVPLGLGAHLEYWGVPAAHIVELDWWDKTSIGSLSVVATPARHISGRYLLDNGSKLWSSYALIGQQHRLYFSGDTGLFPGMRDIGSRLGPFDLTMIEVGQYDRAWPDWHLGPEQAVAANKMVGGRMLLPIHWGAFALAYHSWTEPIERVLAACRSQDLPVMAPRPGQAVEPSHPLPIERWWPELPWKTGEQDPITASLMDR